MSKKKQKRKCEGTLLVFPVIYLGGMSALKHCKDLRTCKWTLYLNILSNQQYYRFTCIILLSVFKNSFLKPILNQFSHMVDVVNVVHRLARDVDVAKRHC